MGGDDAPTGAAPIAELPVAGEMGSMIAAMDWGGSSLGPIPGWPPVLRHAVSTCLSSRFPMMVWWGDDLVQIYNDAYRPALGAKHPRSLGQPARECWPEIWTELEPLASSVRRGDGATYNENQVLFIDRHGYLEETYWTFSYSPIRDVGEAIHGVFVAVHDTTTQVLADRRLRTLRELGEVSTAEAGTVEQAARACVDVLSRHPADAPLAMAYVREDDDVRLVGSYRAPGARRGRAGAAAVPDLDPAAVPGDPDGPRGSGLDGSAWALAVARSGTAQLVDGLLAAHGAEATAGCDTALVLPLAVSGQARPVGALVLGVSPFRALDDDYRAYADLLAGQVSTALTDAVAYSEERRRAESLAELDRAKSEFFANVSHEFRTPLTLIAGPAEDALADADTLGDAQRERLHVIRRNAARLRRLVDDMLDFARIEAGRLVPNLEPVALGALTREIAGSFEPAITRAGLELRVDVDLLSHAVAIDVDMWEKIVLNLLSNALKHTHAGHVAIALREDEGTAVLTVSDTGVGVPADELPLLFQRFHRVRATAGRSHEGAGIGLALVQELARLHGGVASAASVPGEGSTFTVRVPVIPEVAAATAPPATRSGVVAPTYLDEALQWSDAADGADSPVPRPSAPSSGDTVLVVEDNSDLRGFLRRLLEPTWRVLLAGDGEAGLALARSQQPDLVLTDVMMPRLDGFGLLAALRADPATASIPVVFLSARAGEEAAVEGLGAGADDYLPKPFSGAELVARVRANLELARLRTRESLFRRALVDSMQDGFFVADDQGAVVEINRAFAAITGYGSELVPIAFPYPWLSDAAVDPDDRDEQETAFRELVRDGGSSRTLPLRHRDGRRVSVSLSVTSAPGRDGTSRVFVGTVRDVTAERAAADRDAVAARFAAALAASTTLHDVLRAGVMELRRSTGAARVVAAAWGADGDDDVFVAEPDGPVPDAVRVALHGAIDAVTWTTPADGRRELATSIGPAATVWLDLGSADEPRRDGGPAGAAPQADTALPADERVLSDLLVARLAQAVHRARDYEQARTVALTLQEAILGPTDLDRGFAVRYEPAVRPLEVGGDWYDVVALGGDRVGVVVGDCVGRGLSAAAVMGQLRSSCRALLLRETGPASTLDDLDAFAHRIPGAMCTTVFCAVIDLASGEVRYASAGHPPAFVTRPDGTGELLDAAVSLPLGIRAGLVRAEAVTVLPPGAVLLLYTDGLVERRGESLDDGIEAARRSVAGSGGRRPGEVADRLLAELLPAGGHDDDVAVLVHRRQPAPLRLSLPADPTVLVSMRRDLRDWLAASDVAAETADEVLLAADEACANAIEHGYRVAPGAVPAAMPAVAAVPSAVTLTAGMAGRRLDLEVADRGVWRPPDTDPGFRGRGLAMMRAFMDDVTVDAGPSGTTVRMSKEHA